MPDPTCAERIEEHKRSRLDDFADMLKRADSHDEDEREDAMQEMNELPLAVTVSRVWRIDLSTGGPGDWLEVHTDSESYPTRVEYHFNDWFDHASVELTGDDRETAVAFASQVTADFYTEASA